MKTAIIIYPSFSKRFTVQLCTIWSPVALIHNLLCITNFFHFGMLHSIIVYQKSLPGNRYRWIQNFNETILKYTIRTVLLRVSPLRILWINNPHLYSIHNAIQSDFFVFGCDSSILKSPDAVFLYKEYFLTGWIFTYHVGKTCTSVVYKHKSEHAILMEIIRRSMCKERM